MGLQVIIVPIFWNKNKEEKASVISSAERVERLLTGAGITAGVDTTNPMTPGQKFKYWCVNQDCAGPHVGCVSAPLTLRHHLCVGRRGMKCAWGTLLLELSMGLGVQAGAVPSKRRVQTGSCVGKSWKSG